MKILLFVLFAALVAPVAWPQLDLVVSGWFYDPVRGFLFADRPTFLFLHWLAVEGAWALGILLTLLVAVCLLRRKPALGFGAKEWLFLLLALLLGPALIANGALKDHWGRARPREVTAFGGAGAFSSALKPQPSVRTNGSFISGDAAFGFYLPSFAYIAPLSRRSFSRRVFIGGMMAGCLFGLARLAMGAHFLSDTSFAAALMLLLSAALHGAMFGVRSTFAYWRAWLKGD